MKPRQQLGSLRLTRIAQPILTHSLSQELDQAVVVDLGELVGIIYRSDQGQPGQPQAYIHLMQDPPRLVSNIEGTQLYIVGGSYRITQQGIEG